MLKAVQGMSENERDCMIIADQMAIKAGLVFDPSIKKMIGKCTYVQSIIILRLFLYVYVPVCNLLLFLLYSLSVSLVIFLFVFESNA